MNNKQKGFIIVAIIFAIISTVLVVGGYVFMKKSQEETKDIYPETDMSVSPLNVEGWNTYDDKFYGVYIKYPTDWTIRKFSSYTKAVYFEPPNSSYKVSHPKIKLEFISRNAKKDIEENKNSSNINIKISEEKIRNNVIKITAQGNVADVGKFYTATYYFIMDTDHYYLLSLDSANDSKYGKVLDDMAATFNFVSDDNIISKYLLAGKGTLIKELARWAKADAADFKKSYGGEYLGLCSNYHDGQYASNEKKGMKINCEDALKRFAVSFKFIDPDSKLEIEYCLDHSGNIFLGTIDVGFAKCVGTVEKETDMESVK